MIFKSIDIDYNKYKYHIEWILTDHCQLKCSYCFRLNQPRYKFDKEKIFETIEQLKLINDKNKIKLILTGGEPLLIPFFWEIIEKLKLYNIDHDLNSNGQLLKDEYDYESFSLISLSWHTEYSDILLNKLELLKYLNSLNKLNINIVFNKHNISNALYVKSLCEHNNLSYSLVIDINEDVELNIDYINDNNIDIFTIEYNGKKSYINIHDLQTFSKKYKIFKHSICSNNFITIEPNFKIKYSCGIKNIQYLSDLNDYNNNLICNKDYCIDPYAFFDTTKIIKLPSKIQIIKNELDRINK